MPKGSVPYPIDDDPTDEVNPYERLMRRHAVAAGPDVTIDDEIEDEGIEDEDPFAGFVEMAPIEVALAEAEASIEPLGELDAEALEPLGTEEARRYLTRRN